MRRGNKILLLDRAFFPLGWACPAGHLRPREKPVDGMRRELKEETGLIAVKPKLVLRKKRVKNKCIKGSYFHDWFVFEAKAKGRIKRNKGEAKSIGWFTPQEIMRMKLETVWRNWFRELEIL